MQVSAGQASPDSARNFGVARFDASDFLDDTVNTQRIALNLMRDCPPAVIRSSTGKFGADARARFYNPYLIGQVPLLLDQGGNITPLLSDGCSAVQNLTGPRESK